MRIGVTALVAMLALCSSVAAQEPAAAPATAPAPFVAPDFAVPTLVETPQFKLVPLGPALVEIDYRAYMASIEHLQRTFTRSTGWPHANLTLTDAMADMQTEARRFAARDSFAYAVLTPDGARERGYIYVYPGKAGGYDAEVRLWVTQAEFDAGFDAELYAWAQAWIAREWPFAKVAYPGRAIPWEEWDALTSGV
jgi:hypothetical protein